MTPLRQRMTEDMQLRGLAPATQEQLVAMVGEPSRRGPPHAAGEHNHL